MDITSPKQSVELPCNPISENNEEQLDEYGELILDDYREYKTNFIEWLLTEGKDTYRGEGYSESTVKHTHYKVDEAYRWKWERDGEYSSGFTPDEGTALIDFMMKQTSHPDSYIYGFEKSLRRLFSFLRNERNQPIEEWEHDIPVEPSRGSASHVKDRFYPMEMSDLYETALNQNSVRSYYNKKMTSDERDSLKALIAQRLGMPKSEVGPDEFSKASSWKIPSIVAICSDCGLRPIEVGRATVDWFDLENQLMLVPKDEATKNEENWECWLSNKTTNALSNWIKERGSYQKYQGTDTMWLTRHGNPYNSNSLNQTLDKLMGDIEISDKGRNLSWYSFRHGCASTWAEQEDIYRAKEQLRHKSIDTTLQYTRNGSTDAARRTDSVW